jgi:hypothetical protein
MRKWSTSLAFALEDPGRITDTDQQGCTSSKQQLGRPPHPRPHPKSLTARFTLSARTSKYLGPLLCFKHSSKPFHQQHPSDGASSRTTPQSFIPSLQSSLSLRRRQLRHILSSLGRFAWSSKSLHLQPSSAQTKVPTPTPQNTSRAFTHTGGPSHPFAHFYPSLWTNASSRPASRLCKKQLPKKSRLPLSFPSWRL